MQKKYILVVNPISGGEDKSALINTIQEYGKTNAVEVVVFETSGDNDEEELLLLYKKIKADRVIVAGGDGTIKMVAEALEKEQVVFGLIPAGSANGLSVDLGFPDTLDEHLKIAFYNDFMEIDMVSINGKRSLHLSDIGLNAELIRNYENSSIRGKLGYAIQAVNTMTDEEISFIAKIEANGKVIETQAKMVVIANSQKYGTGVVINPVGIMDDGKFEIVVLKNFNIAILSKIVSGNMQMETDDVLIISADKANITTDIPVHFQIDGEYCGEEKCLEVHILPKNLKLAVPDRTQAS